MAMMLARLHLDRNTETPLFRQLRASIEMAIIEGELPDGVALPSVRSLAQLIEVAPITVIQAYKALQQEGMIQSVPKRGFFVSFAPENKSPEDIPSEVRRLADNALDTASRLGVSGSTFARVVLERASQLKLRSRVVAIVGHRYGSLDERVRFTDRALANEKVSVRGIAFEELDSADEDTRNALIAGVDVFLVSVDEIERARRTLSVEPARVLPMTRTATPEVVEFIHRQPGPSVFGIIADSPEYADRILAVLRRLNPNLHTPLVAIVDKPGEVERVYKTASAILVGSLASSRLPESFRNHPNAMTFTSLPDNPTIERLRVRLGDL